MKKTSLRLTFDCYRKVMIGGAIGVVAADLRGVRAPQGFALPRLRSHYVLLASNCPHNLSRVLKFLFLLNFQRLHIVQRTEWYWFPFVFHALVLPLFKCPYIKSTCGEMTPKRIYITWYKWRLSISQSGKYPDDCVQFLYGDLLGALDGRRNLLLML